MSSRPPPPPGPRRRLAYPFFQSVFDRKSRRMGLGMEMPGTLGYESPYEAVPLTELEEALLLVAGTGLTGLNLGDIDPSMGADAMVQWTARTWPSSCSNHGTELFFTNDDGLYFLDMWNLVPEAGEISTLSGQEPRRPGRLGSSSWCAGAKIAAVGRRARSCRPACRACSSSTTGTPTSRARRSSCRSRT